jgi:hypothetical protein
VFEEMLNRYLTSNDADFKLPASIEEYTMYNDFKLYEHLANSKNEWAQRIAVKKPYRMVSEIHTTASGQKAQGVYDKLMKKGFDVIWASSKARLSKYHTASSHDLAHPIYVIDSYDLKEKPTPIHESTEIFEKYESARVIDRLYVAPENFSEAQLVLNS